MRVPYHGLRPALVGIILVASGCYGYTPVRFPAVPTGETVRIELSDEGSGRIERLLGERPTRIQGEVVSSTDVGLSIAQLHLLGGTAPSVYGDRRLDLLPEDLRGVELQKMDRGRTLMLVGLVAVAVGVSFYLIEIEDSGAEPVQRSPGVDFALVPWVQRILNRHISSQE